MQSGDHRWFKIFPQVILCATLWGSAFPAIKSVYRIWQEAGVDAGLSEFWWFGGVRFALAGVMLLMVTKAPWRELKRGDKRLLLSFTLNQTVAQYLLFYYGISISSGTLAGLLAAVGSFWWMLLAYWFGGAAWPSHRQWLAVGIGSTGVMLAAAAPGMDAGRPWLGTFVLVASNFFGTWGLVQFGKLRATMSSRAATGYSLLFGGLVLMAVGGKAMTQLAVLMPPQAIGITLWLAFVSAFAFALWNHLSTRHPVPLMAGYRFLIPIMAMVESMIVLRESPGWGLWVGGLLVFGSLVAAQRANTVSNR